MADFVIFTNYSYLLGNSVDFFKVVHLRQFNHRVLMSRLMLSFRRCFISCGLNNDYIINDAMADFAVYHNFGP